MALPAGLVLREATADDAEAIIDLNTEVFGARQAAAVRHLWEGDGFGPGRWTLVEDGDGRAVSASVLLAHQLRYGRVDLPLGQIEFVATRDPHRRQGLIRAQFDLLHRWAAEAGHLALMIQGIPVIYRGLGYGYAFSWPTVMKLAEPPALPDGYEVVDAGPEDIATVMALCDEEQARCDVAVRWDHARWAWHLSGAPSWNERLLMARRDDEVVGIGWSQARPEEEHAEVGLLVAHTRDAVRALVAVGAEHAGDLEVWLAPPPYGVPQEVLRDHAVPHPEMFHAVYGRIPDPVALLDAIRPELSARLAASPMSREEGACTVSLYDDAFTLHYAGGEVTKVEQAEAKLDPLDDFEPGVPQDQFPALVFGRFGARALELRADDVGLGRDGDLLEVLFPALVVDTDTPL
jgi:hypothetical protein